MAQVRIQKLYMDVFCQKTETFIAIFYNKIWLNLLMDDHQFDYSANFTAKNW
jgi:hypothetical protein